MDHHHHKGTSNHFPYLKSVSKVGSILCNCGTPNPYKRLDAKLEKKLIQVKKTCSGLENNFKSINSIILRFPHFKDGLRDIRGVFHLYDEDLNGIIDREELKRCINKLQLHLTEEEIEDLFQSCDIDGSEGIQFNEFIVLLCLIYLLKKTSSTAWKLDSPELEATFDTIIEVFLFLDKNGDGKLHKKDMVKALNDASPWERSPAHVTKTRFKEMDWDRKGKISFRQFLFGFLNWVGIDVDEQDISEEDT